MGYPHSAVNFHYKAMFAWSSLYKYHFLQIFCVRCWTKKQPLCKGTHCFRQHMTTKHSICLSTYCDHIYIYACVVFSVYTLTLGSNSVIVPSLHASLARMYSQPPWKCSHVPSNSRQWGSPLQRHCTTPALTRHIAHIYTPRYVIILT